MTDREERSDRLQRRFEHHSGAADDGADGDDGDGASGSSTTTASADGDGDSVKDRPSVLMYLPEETRRELDIRFDELNARYKREHGEPLEKNRDYYPAVIRAGLEGERVEDVLGL